MIASEDFYKILVQNGISFFSGVPDSLLKSICAFLADHVTPEFNIISANEGGAIALAAGYHLATGKVPMVYMQNSGIGNAINPLLSLIDKKVYSIPVLLLIGWRGEPGVKDEPQHIKQGEVTTTLLEAMDIPYEILPDEFSEAKVIIERSINFIKENNTPLAFVVKKELFEPYQLKMKIETNFEMNREEAVKLAVDELESDDVVVSTTGKTSRELFEYREELGQKHQNDFLTVGSMGHASQIALGIALQKPDRNIYCFDGDGAVLMHAGSLGIIGDLCPRNYKHIIFNNGAHDSVGGQPTVGHQINIPAIAKGFNYKEVFVAEDRYSLKAAMKKLKQSEGPVLLEIKINKGSRKDLGRPTSTPLENKDNFMGFLKR
jgi:phosphonopyruvate decarboxylase